VRMAEREREFENGDRGIGCGYCNRALLIGQV
jgi:hypothetical protein